MKLEVSLLSDIQYIGKIYGARKEVSEEVQEECLELLTTEFKHLGAIELKESFRLFALNKFEVKSGEMYGGEFNAMILARVLVGYESYRRKVVEEHLKIEMKAKRELELQEKRAKEKIEFNQNFESELKSILAKANSWKDLPGWLYMSCFDRGLIKFKESEANKIYLEGQEIAKMELEIEKSISTSRHEAKRLSKMLSTGNYKERSKIIARKISVFRKLKN